MRLALRPLAELTALLACIGLPLLLTGVSPLQLTGFGNDAPEHMFAAQAIWQGLQVAETSGIATTVSITPASNGFLYLAGLLNLVGQMPVAFFAAWLLMLGGIVAFMARSSSGSAGEGLPIVAALPLSLSWVWYAGFMNWLVTIGLALPVVAYFSRDQPWTIRQALSLAVVLLLIGHLHLFVAVQVGLWVALHVLLVHADSSLVRRLALVALIGAPVLMLQLFVSSLHIDEVVQSHEQLVWTLRNPAEALGLLGTGGPAWRWAPSLFLAVVGIVQSARAGAEPGRRAMALWATVMLVAAWVLPLSIRGWEWFSPRLGFTGIAAGIACVRLLPGTWMIVTRAALIVWACAAMWWSADLASRYWAGPCGQLQEALAETSAETDAARRGIVPLRSCTSPGTTWDDPLLPRLTFAGHLGAAIAAADGGVPVGWGFDPTIHPWIITSAPALPPNFTGMFVVPDILLQRAPAADDMLRIAALTRVAQEASVYSGPVVIADPSHLPAILAWGFRTLYSRGQLHRLDWQGCRLTLHVAGGQPWAWRGGWIPTSDPWHGGEYPAGTDQTPIQTVGCGPVWVEIRASDGSPCLEADANGWLVVDTRGQNTLHCSLPETTP